MRFFNWVQFGSKFNFAGKILIKQSREEMESFLDQYHILKDRKERKMLLTGFEQANFDRGYSSGVEDGEKNSEKRFRKQLDNFIEKNKDLDKDEFLKNSKFEVQYKIDFKLRV